MSEELVLDIVIDSSKSDGSIAGMKKEVRELQGLLTNLDPNSEEFAKAAKRAAELKDNIDDANDSINSMKGSENSVEGITSAFGRMQDKIKNLDFEGVGKELTNMSISLKNFNPAAFMQGIGTMIKGLGKLALAIITNPIFLITAAVAAASYALYKYAEAQEAANTASEVASELREKQGQLAASELIQLRQLEEQLRANINNKNEFNALVEKWNTTYGKKYNASLIATTANLDAITNAANKARESILKKALAAAAEEKLQEIVSDNIVMYQTYITATESLRLKKAALAKEEEMYNYFIEQGMTDAAIAQRTYINTLKDKIAVGYEAYGLDEDYVKEIEILTQVIDNNAIAAEEVTTVTKNYNAAIKDVTKNTKELKKEIEEPIEFTINEDKGPQQITEDIERLKKEWIDARNTIKSESLFRALEGEEWDIVREKMMDFYGQGIINEEQFNNTLIQYAALNRQANEEAYEFGLVTFEEFEKNKTEIARMENEKRLDIMTTYTQGTAALAQDLLTLLGNINDKDSKKQKKIKKAAFTVDKINSATQTGIATAKAVMEAAPNIPLQVFVGLQGAAAIAAILSKKYNEEGSGGGTSVSTNVSTPSSSIATPSITNLYTAGGGTPTTFQSLSANNQGMNRVYVVESDITGVQANVAKVNVVSTF